jgi:hypothetical protein
MVGEKQKALADLLSTVGAVTSGVVGIPTKHDVAGSPLCDGVESVYQALGGILASFPLNLRSWDIEFNAEAVELDEELHFNRYRTATLRSEAYSRLPEFPLYTYKDYCVQHEGRCLQAGSYGRKWTNPSCEKQFGKANTPKDLSGNGAPRWKQRAFYDFVKDLSPLVINVPVIRISIWDTFDDGGTARRVKDSLSDPWETSAEALADLIASRSPSQRAG